MKTLSTVGRTVLVIGVYGAGGLILRKKPSENHSTRLAFKVDKKLIWTTGLVAEAGQIEI